MRRRRTISTMLVAAFVLVVLDTLGWLAGQLLLDRQLDRLQEAAVAAGWRFDHAATGRGGWPFSVARTFTAPRLLPLDQAGGLRWTGDGVSAAISVLHPATLTIHLVGGQAIAAAGSGLRRSLRFRGDPVQISLPLYRRSGPPTGDAGALEFAASRLRVAFPDRAASPTGLLVDAARVNGRLRWTATAHALTLAAQGIVLSDGGSLAIPGGALELSLTGGLPVRGDTPWTDRLQAWRAAGGRLLLTTAALRWPDAQAGLTGSATLDGDFLADGTLSLHVAAPERLLDHVTRAGLLSDAQAVPVRALIGLLRSARGSAPHDTFDLPLVLHRGVLALGQLPLLQVPPLGGMQAPVR